MHCHMTYIYVLHKYVAKNMTIIIRHLGLDPYAFCVKWLSPVSDFSFLSNTATK